MMKENIMNGRMLTDNDNWGIGVAMPKGSMEIRMQATLPEHKVTVSHTLKNCRLSWQPCENADKYRVDIYRIEDRGPHMNDLNYILIDSGWVTETEYTTAELKRATSYMGIVFAYNGDECLGRYPYVFCVTSSEIIGDMLSDETDDFEAVTVKAWNDFDIVFHPLNAEKSVILNSNPDRGFRAEEDYFVPADEELAPRSAESYLEEVRRRIEKNVHGQKATVSRVYFILNKYVNTEVLPQGVLDFMQGIFDAYRTLGVKMYLCHYYQHGGKAEPVSQDIVLSHLKQISPLWEKNADVLHAMNFTFLGCYGEWTCMRKPVDRQLFVNEFMKAAPESVRLIMRHPLYKHLFVNKEYWRYPRIGFADDACHGLMFPNIDLGQSFTQPNSVWWDMCKRESVYTLNDGELFTTRWIRLSGSWPRGISCMQSLSERHETTFSIQHGYGDICQFGSEIDQTCMYSWMGEQVTEKLLDDMGLAYTSGWFYNADGKKIKRNAFEYIRDHLGYRISAKDAHIKKNDTNLSVRLDLVNYGYGAAFNLKSGFAVLDEKGNVLTDIPAGNPETWYGTDPERYESRKLLTHTVSAVIPLSNVKEKYSVAFYIKNSLGQFARMDNSMEYKNGYHILCKIEG